ncbi:MAG: twin-arginine translocation signal domain-containing protein, partial [Desulfobacteraceae bacterium]|nr:twin-arginine translocation signal domain-containing protein [Desulfobacteraceae bacterium]
MPQLYNGGSIAMQNRTISRRDFLKIAAGTTAAL